MTVARNPIADLCAIAAMPGLEALAEAIAPVCTLRTDPVSQIVFLAGQWTLGSRNKLTSVLEHESTWSEMRESAARVGRCLPVAPPTQNQLRHVRGRAGAGFGQVLADAFTVAMAPLTRSVGLLPEHAPRNLLRPDRANIAYGDGSKFKALSDIHVDLKTGELVGSRATDDGSPRMLVPEVEGANRGVPQIPLVTMGVHGDKRWQRVVLGVGLYLDYREMDASMNLFHKVHSVYGESIHAYIYDMAMTGDHIQAAIHAGVIPIVAQRGAPPHNPGVTVPDGLRFVLGRSNEPKNRAAIFRLPNAAHWVGARECVHAVWALDGALVTCDPADLRPSFDSTALGTPHLAFADHPAGDGQQLFATYRVHCRNGHIEYTLDLSGYTATAKGGLVPLARHVRPIDPTGSFTELRGLRSDVESSYRTIKARSELFGRSSSLAPDHVLADMVGAGLWINAVAWDVHAAQHTDNGRRLAASLARPKRSATTKGAGCRSVAPSGR